MKLLMILKSLVFQGNITETQAIAIGQACEAVASNPPEGFGTVWAEELADLVRQR